uniref:GG11994 n=1 Tax=Drosophila erecta TaxID=7220 RepID=B3P5B7_DROER
MYSNWPKQEDTFCYKENIKAEQLEDVIVINDDVKEKREKSKSRVRTRAKARKKRKAAQKAAQSTYPRDVFNKIKKRTKQKKPALKKAKVPKKPKGPGPPKAGEPNGAAIDNLVMALVDEFHEDGYLLNEKWEEIETRLAHMVTDRVMAMPGGPVPSFDSSDVIRGHRVIRCVDGFSKIFLAACIDTIGDSWDGMRIRLVHVSDIPWRPQARIWLPHGQMDHNRILICLRAQNLDIDMSDWSILRAEEITKTSQTFLLLINRRCLPQLEAADYKVRYGIRMTRIKVMLSQTDVLPKEDET